MQAILAAMAAHSILTAHPHHFASPSSPLLPPHSSARPFHSALLGRPVNLSPASFRLAAAAPKPLAVAVLKGSSLLEGFVTLIQEDDGYVVPDRKCFSCPAAWGSAAVSCHGAHQLFQGANALKNLPVYSSRRAPFACKATPNNHRRNPDFSRQHKGASRGKSRPFRERENSETLEETDLLPSKNGPVLSLPSNQRYQATATPGRREKEIVELFRKVQAQLRARAAIKEEKKVEASQGQGEKGTVDSLLKLLRKHSLDQGKKSGGEDVNLDQVESNKPFEEEQNSSLFGPNNITSEEIHQPDPVDSTRRPASNFRRKSPVPRVKFQPVFSAEEEGSSSSSLKSQGSKSAVDDQDPEIEPLEETDDGFLCDPVFLVDPSEGSDTDEAYEETTETSATESADLGSLKLSELRGLAKSRGIKGYSRLKKSELVELLSGDGA